MVFVVKANSPLLFSESNCIIYYDLYISFSLPSLHLVLSLIPLKLMARGGGLSIDSDPIESFFPHKPVILNSFPEDNNNNNNNNSSSQHKWKLGPNMDRSPSSSTPNTTTNNTTSTIPFQVNLTSSDNKKSHIDEMDFFPNKTNDDDDNNNHGSAFNSAPPSLNRLHHTHDHSSSHAILELNVNVSHHQSSLSLNPTTTHIIHCYVFNHVCMYVLCYCYDLDHVLMNL